MLGTLEMCPPDKIISLLGMFRADPRVDKLDLGVGVYKDSAGDTVILNAVKSAEKRLHEGQSTKNYIGIAGDEAFIAEMQTLLLGPSCASSRIAAVQSPGGSGALRLIAELISRASPDATVWLSDPTWPNHFDLQQQGGLKVRSYPYFDRETRSVDFGRMQDALKSAGPSDVVLLHGCCHNPTGANLTLDQWQTLADSAAHQGFVPFIDIAYQGFGDGLDEDAAGLRVMAETVPEMFVASSCSKNFAVYRDRVGMAMAISESAEQADITQSNLMTLSRRRYSMPPDHGAAVVRMVLHDSALREEWRQELAGMRNRMLNLRQRLATTLREKSGSDRHGFIAAHRGMFSLLGATPEQVARLLKEHGIYMTGDSRINVAGLLEDRIEFVADAILDVGL